ncbi:hypothetical protein J2S00_002288 [Caldalkalibacillus uzonensis]|uniref:ISLre2 family transposase n=1 Tax=Caldalkalibacillus uzonensis TaxID=353224 RepID=A0ABU0CSZ0_9BACI|nr:ISLre2 family transposase [Caldalkalibacillus uzonensis]MDQ0339500.1 hypothetical protein [Caldalkalibacillus uzonensis]
MQKLTTKIPTIKDLEGLLFRKLQEQFSEGMRRILEALDDWIMEQRDTARFRLKDQREISIDTLFGTVRFKRRLYLDRKTGKHVFLLDRMMQYEGRDKLSPNLEELAIQFASQGPSYRDSAQRLEALLGYRVLSHEAIRDKLIVQAERTEPSEGERRPVRVLFVEVDGLYTKLQRERRRGMENRIAVVHEGWESEGGRVRLKAKRYYYHTGDGDFWEGFGDFLVQHYDMDEQTWLVVNGDGADWIGECTSYFTRCIYTLDRFHVVRELRRYVGHLPKVWKAIRKSLASFDADMLLETLAAVPETQIAEEWREEWRKYRAFLKHHREHLRDYRDKLRKAGIDTSKMRPMGSAEAQMRIMAKRTKRGGYSWSVRGVRAMLKTIMKSKEGRPLTNLKGDTSQNFPFVNTTIRQWLQEVKRQSKGCINGTIRLLLGPMQSSPTGRALKGLIRGN